MKTLGWIVTVLGGGLVLLLAFGALQENKPHVSGYTQINGQWVAADEGDRKADAKRGVANCWQEQARKSLAPPAARSLASMCENMEADFVRTYREKP